MAGRGQYTSGFPLQEIRMRNWPAGKVAALKRAVSILENELNQTMASQVDQGAARKFSARVPRVTGVVIRAGFKNFNLTFDAARGIQDLLFYEIQKSSTASFADVTTFTIPQTTLTIPTATEHEQVYFRIRCVNSKFEVGPWSTSVTATGSSNFRINITRAARTVVQIPFADADEWVDITGVSYTPTAASICINIHAGAYTPITERTRSGSGPNEANNSAVRFRVLRNGVALTNTGTLNAYQESTYSAGTGESGTDEEGNETAMFGTMTVPFETFIGNEPGVTFTLQAMLLSDFSQRQITIPTGTGTEPVYVIVDVFDLMEVVQTT